MANGTVGDVGKLTQEGAMHEASGYGIKSPEALRILSESVGNGAITSHEHSHEVMQMAQAIMGLGDGSNDADAVQEAMRIGSIEKLKAQASNSASPYAQQILRKLHTYYTADRDMLEIKVAAYFSDHLTGYIDGKAVTVRLKPDAAHVVAELVPQSVGNVEFSQVSNLWQNSIKKKLEASKDWIITLPSDWYDVEFGDSMDHKPGCPKRPLIYFNGEPCDIDIARAQLLTSGVPVDYASKFLASAERVASFCGGDESCECACKDKGKHHDDDDDDDDEEMAADFKSCVSSVMLPSAKFNRNTAEEWCSRHGFSIATYADANGMHCFSQHKTRGVPTRNVRKSGVVLMLGVPKNAHFGDDDQARAPAGSPTGGQWVSSGGSSGGSSSTGDSSKPASDKSATLLEKAKSLAKPITDLVGSVKDAVMSKLEKRYGSRWAKAIVGTGIVANAIPAPGTAPAAFLAMVAAAEIHHQLVGESPKTPQAAFGDDSMSKEDIAKAAKEFMEELKSAIAEKLGGKNPFKGSAAFDADIRALDSIQNVLAMLRALYWLYTHSHWQTEGDDFYGNHLLFERLYNKLAEDTDEMAEKAVGYFGPSAVEPMLILGKMQSWVAKWTQTSDITYRMVNAEEDLQNQLKSTYDNLKNQGNLSLGLDDFIMSLANSHETNQYLLRQASQRNMSFGSTPAAFDSSVVPQPQPKGMDADGVVHDTTWDNSNYPAVPAYETYKPDDPGQQIEAMNRLADLISAPMVRLMRYIPGDLYNMAKTAVMNDFRRMSSYYGEWVALNIIAGGLNRMPLDPTAPMLSVAPHIAVAEIYRGIQRPKNSVQDAASLKLGAEQLCQLGYRFIQRCLATWVVQSDSVGANFATFAENEHITVGSINFEDDIVEINGKQCHWRTLPGVERVCIAPEGSKEAGTIVAGNKHIIGKHYHDAVHDRLEELAKPPSGVTEHGPEAVKAWHDLRGVLVNNPNLKELPKKSELAPMPSKNADKEEIDKWIKNVEQNPFIKKAMELVEKASASGKDSRDLYGQHDAKGNLIVKDGFTVWEPEREAMHKKMIADALNPEAAAAPGQKPVAIFLAGQTGAGKSTLLKQAQNDPKWAKEHLGDVMADALNHKFTKIDADALKEKLPEYRGWNAYQLHEETSEMTKQICAIAIANKHNLIWDGTAAYKESTIKKMEALAKAGYEVHILNVATTPQISAGRAVNRFLENPFGVNGDKYPNGAPMPIGRFLHPDFVLNDIDSKPGKNYPEYKHNPVVKSWASVSTADGGAELLDKGSR